MLLPLHYFKKYSDFDVSKRIYALCILYEPVEKCVLRYVNTTRRLPPLPTECLKEYDFKKFSEKDLYNAFWKLGVAHHFGINQEQELSEKDVLSYLKKYVKYLLGRKIQETDEERKMFVNAMATRLQKDV